MPRVCIWSIFKLLTLIFFNFQKHRLKGTDLKHFQFQIKSQLWSICERFQMISCKKEAFLILLNFFFQISCRDQWMWQTIKIVILEKRVIQQERKNYMKRWRRLKKKQKKEFLVLIFHDDRFKKKERKNIKLVIESP